jgi:hypothetical protein
MPDGLPTQFAMSDDLVVDLYELVDETPDGGAIVVSYMDVPAPFVCAIHSRVLRDSGVASLYLTREQAHALGCALTSVVGEPFKRGEPRWPE